MIFLRRCSLTRKLSTSSAYTFFTSRIIFRCLKIELVGIEMLVGSSRVKIFFVLLKQSNSCDAVFLIISLSIISVFYTAPLEFRWNVLVFLLDCCP